MFRDDDDDKSDNSDENDTFALTNRQKEMERRKMQETILAAAEGRFLAIVLLCVPLYFYLLHSVINVKCNNAYSVQNAWALYKWEKSQKAE